MRNLSAAAALAAAIVLSLSLVDAHAAPLSPSLRCEVGKLSAVAAYTSCRLKADAKAITKNTSPDYSSCDPKITPKFPRLEAIAGPGVCPSNGDVGDIQGRSDVFESEIAILLSGGTLPTPVCGDGNLDAGEQCEVGNLAGQTCASRGFFNGTLACAPGCTFDTSACHATRFEDNTTSVIDHQTGLEWEKKDGANGTANLADPHDVDNTYTWSLGASATTQSGSAFSDFLVKLNGVTDNATTTTSGCYGNHCDWRVPTVDELKTIAVLSPGCSSPPCVQDALLTPARSGRYWTDSAFSGTPTPTGAFFVDFSTGATGADFKTAAYFVRAVRTAP